MSMAQENGASVTGGSSGGSVLQYFDPRYWGAAVRDSIIETLLNYLFGEYLKEINRESFKLSFLGGEVTVYGLELKRGALDFLKIPIAVEEGILGCLEIVIPWDKLSTKPVVVTISDLWLVAKPLSSFDFTEETEEDVARKSTEKKKAIKALQERWEQQQAKRWGGVSIGKTPTMIEKIIHTILQLIEVRINHVHILFEDVTTDEKYPYTLGVAVDSIHYRANNSENGGSNTRDEAEDEHNTTKIKQNNNSKLIDIRGFRAYLNSCKVSELKTFKIDKQKLAELGVRGPFQAQGRAHSQSFSDVEGFQNHHFDNKKEQRPSFEKEFSGWLGETFAAIFSMLRKPPINTGEMGINSETDNARYPFGAVGQPHLSRPDSFSGILRPKPGDSFQRWSMVKESSLDIIVQPINCQLRFGINKDDITRSDDDPKKSLEVVFGKIMIELRESQFGHMRSFVLFLNRYDRYDKYRRLAGWRPKQSIHIAHTIRSVFFRKNYKIMRHWYHRGGGSQEKAKEYKKLYGHFPPSWQRLKAWHCRKWVVALFLASGAGRGLHDDSSTCFREWWQYAIDAVVMGLRESKKRAKWMYIQEYILRRSRYITLYKRSRIGGKMWVVAPHVQRELETALGSWDNVRLNDPRLALAARIQIQISHGAPLGSHEIMQMDSIEELCEIPDVMLFRRIAEAQLELEYYRVTRNKKETPRTRTHTSLSFQSDLAHHNIHHRDLEGEEATSKLSLEEKLELYSYISYNPKAEKLRVLPSDYIMQQLHVIIKQTQFTFVTKNGSKEDLVASTTCLHILRKPEVDKIEFSIGDFSIIDHSVVDNIEAGAATYDNSTRKQTKAVKRRHAAPAQLLNILKGELRSKLGRGRQWHPPLRQILRSQRRFQYFKMYLGKRQRDQNLLFFIEAEHYETMQQLLPHYPLSQSGYDRPRLAKEIYSRFISKKAGAMLISWGASLENEKQPEKLVIEQARLHKAVKRLHKVSEGEQQGIFKSLKTAIWSELLVDFRKFMSNEWNFRFHHFKTWCTKQNLNSGVKESIFFVFEHRAESALSVAQSNYALQSERGVENYRDARKRTFCSANAARYHAPQEIASTHPMMGASSIILDISNLIASVSTSAMIDCLSLPDGMDLEGDNDTQNNDTKISRAPAILSVYANVGEVEINVTTEMVMRLGSFFLMYEKKLQLVVERTSTDVSKENIHARREKTRAWKAFDESKVELLLQKPNALVVEINSGGFQVRLPVERKVGEKSIVLYAVLLNCGALELSTSNSKAASEVPGLIESSKAGNSLYDMYDLNLPRMSLELVHFANNVESKDAFTNSALKTGSVRRTQWHETLISVERTRLRSYQSRIPEHPEWPKTAVSVVVPKIWSSFSDRGVEDFIMWFAYWNASWVSLQQGYITSQLNIPHNSTVYDNSSDGTFQIDPAKNAAHNTTSGASFNSNEEHDISQKMSSSFYDFKAKRHDLLSQIENENDTAEKNNLRRLLSKLNIKEQDYEIAHERALTALERREELIFDLRCDSICVGIVIRTKKMNLFTAETNSEKAEDDSHVDLELDIQNICLRQTKWTVRHSIHFGLQSLVVSDFLSMDVNDKASPSVLYLVRLIHTLASHNPKWKGGTTPPSDKIGLGIDMIEIKELSEQYKGEDKLITATIPAFHIIVPLKTVEALVSIYNSVDKALKTSAKTFMREMAAIRKKHLQAKTATEFSKGKQVSPPWQHDAETVVSATEQLGGTAKDEVGSPLPQPAKIHAAQERIAIRIHVVIEEVTIEFTYDLKEPLFMVTHKYIDVLQIKYVSDERESKIHNLDVSMNSFSKIANMHEDEVNAEESNNSTANVGEAREQSNIEEGDGYTSLKATLSGPIAQNITVYIKNILAKGNCFIDENGPMYGVYTYPQFRLEGLQVKLLSCSKKLGVWNQSVQVIHAQVVKVLCEVSRRFSARNSSSETLHDSIVRTFLDIDYISLTVEKQVMYDKSGHADGVHDVPISICNKISAHSRSIKSELDPLSVAGVASYGRVIQRVVEGLKVKHNRAKDSKYQNQNSEYHQLDVFIDNVVDVVDPSIDYEDSDDNEIKGALEDKKEETFEANSVPHEVLLDANIEHVNILLLVPSNSFNSPSSKSEKKRLNRAVNSSTVSKRDIESTVVSLSDVTAKVDLLPPDLAKEKNCACVLNVSAMGLQLLDESKAGKLHSHIIDEIKHKQNDPLITIKVDLPFHKGTPMHTFVEVNNINFVNLNRFMTELMAFAVSVNHALHIIVTFANFSHFLLSPG